MYVPPFQFVSILIIRVHWISWFKDLEIREQEV
jgi:hypothetical protein